MEASEEATFKEEALKEVDFRCQGGGGCGRGGFRGKKLGAITGV